MPLLFGSDTASSAVLFTCVFGIVFLEECFLPLRLDIKLPTKDRWVLFYSDITALRGHNRSRKNAGNFTGSRRREPRLCGSRCCCAVIAASSFDNAARPR